MQLLVFYIQLLLYFFFPQWHLILDFLKVSDTVCLHVKQVTFCAFIWQMITTKPWV